jgi:methionyl-tRNA formyltransferase
LKILFFGSSDFSVPFLREFKNSKHIISLVITGIDKIRGRGKKSLPNPVKEAAVNSGYNFLEIESFSGKIIGAILKFNFDCIVLISFGKILPKQLLNSLPGSCINVHPSLLPKYRGPSPIISTLLNGDKKTGISIIKMTEKVDEGDIFLQSEFAVSDDDNKDLLEEKLIKIGVPLLFSVLDLIEDGKIETFPQNNKLAMYTNLFHKDDLKINWNLNAEKIINKVRAFSTSPGSYTNWRGKNIKIIKAKKIENLNYKIFPGNTNGEIISASKKDGLLVRCNKKEIIKIELLKPQDKNIMYAVDFINGYPVKIGDIFE